MSNKALTAEFINESQQLHKLLIEKQESIIDRIDFIVKTIYKVFDQTISTWYFYGAEEGKVGDVWPALKGNIINFNAEIIIDWPKTKYYDFAILDIFGHECCINYCFPIRWLYDESFEQEIVKGKQLYLEKQAKEKLLNKEKRQLKKLETDKLVTEAKKKLSKQELAALKQSLKD